MRVDARSISKQTFVRVKVTVAPSPKRIGKLQVNFVEEAKPNGPDGVSLNKAREI